MTARVLAVTVCVLVGVLVSSNAAGAAPVWSVQPSPGVGPISSLAGVACVSASSCTAVGSYLDGMTRKTLIESWNGSKWSVVPSPNQTNYATNQLTSVSCLSSTFCTAVGWSQAQSGRPLRTLIESWDGSTWTIVASPPPSSFGGASNQLSGVSCVAGPACTAVGWYGTSSGRKTLIESWSGTSWARVTGENPGAYNNQLNSVSCASATACTAVGYYTASGSSPSRTMVERWNGTAWAAVASPNNGAESNQLNSVSCASAASCKAVGSYTSSSTGTQRTLIESWNGSTWSLVASPNNGTNNNQLKGVRCTSLTACTAVGSYSNGSIVQALMESWNGSTWSLVTTPNVGSSSLNDITRCVAPTSCTAVGSLPSGKFSRTLVESWNGSAWKVVASPSIGTYNSYLDGVSCVSTTSCKAVGWYYDGSVRRPLIESWNGSTWSRAASPNVAGGLFGVSCVSTTSCKAVGVGGIGSGASGTTLIESWNGSTWSVVTAPTVTGTLNGVSCVSTTSCKAVGWTGGSNQMGGGNGTYFTGGGSALIESWNGTTWSVVTSPRPGTAQELNSVSCVSTTSCKAVGTYLGGGSTSGTLIESWNGSTWSRVTSPNNGTFSNGLHGVSCVSTTSCTAVGYDWTRYPVFEGYVDAPSTLIEAWNGSTWSVVNSPDVTPPDGNRLNSVSCTSPTSCTAVGAVDTYSNTGTSGRTLVESWDGTTWSVVASPDGGSNVPNELDGVSCVSTTSCKAVGWYGSFRTNLPLVESYG